MKRIGNLSGHYRKFFFVTSRVQIFADEKARNSFKARRLNRYLNQYIDTFFVARSDDGGLMDILPDALKIRRLMRSSMILVTKNGFAPFCASYPCHLHINVSAHYRNHGVGAALTEAFAAQASNARALGMHIAMNEGARNISFYERNNFRILSTNCSNGARAVHHNCWTQDQRQSWR